MGDGLKSPDKNYPTATSTPAPVLREVRPGAINARRAEMKQAREEKRKAAKAE